MSEARTFRLLNGKNYRLQPLTPEEITASDELIVAATILIHAALAKSDETLTQDDAAELIDPTQIPEMLAEVVQ